MKKLQKNKILIFKLSFFTVIVFLILISFYNLYYSNKILQGVYFNNIDFSSDNKEEALKKIKEKIIINKEISVQIGDKEYQIPFAKINLIADENLIYRQIFKSGRENFISHYLNIQFFFYGKRDVSIPFSYDKDLLDFEIATIYAKEYPENRNAYFFLKDSKLQIADGTDGNIVDYVNLKSQILANLKMGEFSYKANYVKSIPQIKKEELAPIIPQIEQYLKSVVVLENKEQKLKYQLSSEDLLSLLEFSSFSKNKITIVPNVHNVAQLSETVGLNFNREEKAMKVDVVENGVEFSEPIDGIKVREEILTKDIEQFVKNYFSGESNATSTLNIPLSLIITAPKKTDNKYGIKELIGEGVSYFKGSINARVNNIVTASAKINGTLIAPGEEFSFVKAVGPIDAKAGFDTAYIISQGRTILGTGGGVCQVSSTVFRSALNSGLPVTKRVAHAYRVGYYEQNSELGQDATIYQPSVDFKFKNDTENNVLLTASVDRKNSTMYVKLWGTKDGRQVEVSKTKILSQTPPPATIYEDTNTLPKGKLVQMEHSAWGARVVFSRIVKDKNGKEIINEEYKSSYVPWPAVYKRGV